MEDYKQSLEDLASIRRLMESSTRFMSLSGLSGVAAGVAALLGAVWVYTYLDGEGLLLELVPQRVVIVTWQQFYTLWGMALVILVGALGSAIFFTVRHTRRQGKALWTPSSRKLLVNMMVPLAVGAVACLLLAWHGYSSLVPGLTLIFYGLALLNASRYTLREVQLLGYSEMALGLVAIAVLQHSILFWAIGFGLLHILYGTIMYFNHER